LFVHGLLSADTIILTPGSPGQLVLSFNGRASTFAADEVTAVRVRSHAGDDVLDAFQAAVPVYAFGGSGSDILQGGAGNDTLDGGEGLDRLSGGPGVNQLSGGSGIDEVFEAATGAFVLTNTQLTVSTSDDRLTSFERVSLTSLGSSTFDVSGWTGTGAITGQGAADLLIVTRNANITLADDGLSTGDGLHLSLDGIEAAVLTGGARNNSLDARAFTGAATLGGGGGNDLLLGGAGADLIDGGDGRDVILGGRGADRLGGDGGEDLIIAGTTAHDSNLAALRAIAAEWSRTDRPYQARVQALRVGGGLNGAFVLDAQTVFGDDQPDDLTGGDGLDWFFARASDDLVLDLTTLEQLTVLA
jgi:Ca2+-binding RTX toxin-like protein